MRNRLSILIISACIISLIMPVAAKTENRFVRFSFEIDKKRVQENFQLFFYVNKVEIEPLRFENGFVVPEEIDGHDKFDVRVVFKNYDLLFEAVPVNAFKYDWIVGVDLRPFDPGNIIPSEKPPTGKKLAFIYYIHYVARTKEQADTVNIIKVYK